MQRIGYIIRSYPRLSQTFIVNEILALEQQGVALHLFPITDPREPIVQAQVRQVRAPIEFLEQARARGRIALAGDHLAALRAAPARYARARAYVAQRADLDQGYTSASRAECLDMAVYLAALLRREARAGRPIGHLHAHFAHDPALIALLAQQLTGISFSFTAHARDLVQIPAHLLNERAARATAMLTCSATNLAYIDQVMPAELQAKVRLIHHGVNLAGFQPLAGRIEADAGAGRELLAAQAVPRILSVGRLVEKKGFPDLIRACARVRDAGLAFQCAIYGEGPLEGELRALIDTLGLAEAVTLPGACSQQELIPELQRADLFALASFVTDDGDRDGVPNVLVEAMACGLPVVSTTVAGIPELVESGENGVLVPPRDVAALAGALAALLRDPAERARMARAARRTVVEHFDLQAAAQQIADLFEKALASPPKTAPVNV